MKKWIKGTNDSMEAAADSLINYLKKKSETYGELKRNLLIVETDVNHKRKTKHLESIVNHVWDIVYEVKKYV